jgi:hypothetical protein
MMQGEQHCSPCYLKLPMIVLLPEERDPVALTAHPRKLLLVVLDHLHCGIWVHL